MKEHIMKLNPSPMKMIKEGFKTIELRLFDEKRQTIAVGDKIKFINTDDEDDVLNVKVEALFIYDSFVDLYNSLPLLECGYTEEDIDQASPCDMELYYSKEQQGKYGVVGIKISMI